MKDFWVYFRDSENTNPNAGCYYERMVVTAEDSFSASEKFCEENPTCSVRSVDEV